MFRQTSSASSPSEASHCYLNEFGFTALDTAVRLRAALQPVDPNFPSQIPFDLQENVFQAFDEEGEVPTTRGDQRRMAMNDALAKAWASKKKFSPGIRTMVRWAGIFILHCVMILISHIFLDMITYLHISIYRGL